MRNVRQQLLTQVWAMQDQFESLADRARWPQLGVRIGAETWEQVRTQVIADA